MKAVSEKRELFGSRKAQHTYVCRRVTFSWSQMSRGNCKRVREERIVTDPSWGMTLLHAAAGYRLSQRSRLIFVHSEKKEQIVKRTSEKMLNQYSLIGSGYRLDGMKKSEDARLLSPVLVS